MAERRNTRLAGHGLQAEGKPYVPGEEELWLRTHQAVGVGLCSCGATSDVVNSDGARKRWHAEHKQAVRAQLEASRAAS